MSAAKSAAIKVEDQPSCSIERSLQILGERWTLLVMREVVSGNHRFADIRTSLGVASNLLSDRLKNLVDAGVLRTESYREPGKRPRESYHLTPAGEELQVVLGALQQWGDHHRPRPSGASATRRSLSTGETVRVGFVDGRGHEVPADEVTLMGPPLRVGRQEAKPELLF